MDIQFEIYVVVHVKSLGPENVLVSTVFNDALNNYLVNSEKEIVYLEIWKDGKLTSTCRTIEDFVAIGKIKHVNYSK